MELQKNKNEYWIYKNSNCTRLKACKECPFKGSNFNRVNTDQDQYHRDAMIGMVERNEPVWTCLHHLTKDKTMRAQCHIGAKQRAVAEKYVNGMTNTTQKGKRER